MTRSRTAQDVRRLAWALCLAFAAAGVWAAAQSNVTLNTPSSPSAGQPGVQVITLTGSNFPAGTIQPADITVTLRPSTTGAGATGSTPAATIATVIGTSRRVTFTIPTTIAVVNPVAYLVSIAGRTTTGVSFASTNAAAIAVNPPPQITALVPASSNPGTSVTVAITTTLTNFVQGATQANFGPGVSVGGAPVGSFGPVTVASPTSATAQLTIAATATPGPATVTVKTGVQTATLTGAFTIVTPPPTNHAPVVTAGAAQTITLPGGATLAGAVSDDGLPSGATLTSDWARFSGPGAVTFGNASSAATTATFDQAGTYVLRLTASDSQLTSHDDTTVIVLPRPNRPPTITSAPTLTGTESQPYSYQAAATDPDGDAITWRLVTAPNGMTIDPLGAIAWTPAHDQVGAQAVVVEASDGLGGTDRQAYSVAVAPAVTLSSIDATPELLRFSALGAARAVTVTGMNSDGSTVDLTHASATTYESNSPFVATVDADGTVHAVASGGATITVRNGQFTDTAAVVVEPGVTLDALELTPAITTLRTVGGSIAMTLRGHFSDGDARDLTTADGTVYMSSAAGVAAIDASGRVTAVGSGDATMTARYDVLSATAVVHVVVSSGTGFLRGQVLDDSTGLPLGAAEVQLIADGGGPLALPVTATADDHGRFVVPGRAGDAVVRVTKAGFTVVERVATIPADGALTLLDARLTPINSRANQVASVFGGTASDAAGVLTLSVAPGALASNADLRLTSVSGQGLQGRLPFGWSPVAAVDVGPAGVAFAQPASLVAFNAANLAPGTPVVVAVYDALSHQWISSGTSQVGVDGRSIPISVGKTGQIVCIVADDAPFTPAVSPTGDALAGSNAVALPADVSATGQVVPRSAPPGDQARAVGSVLLQSVTPLPSGVVVQASVSERFDLIDQTQIVPRSFTEDLVLYSRGRPSGDGILGATFPITPSRSLSIQELLHGVVSLEVGPPAADVAATVVGAAGAVVVNAVGDSFEVPAAALTADTVVDIQRVSADQTLIAMPSGFDLLAAIDLDLVGVTLGQPGRLSIAAPPDVGAGDQVLLAMVVEDPLGALGLRLIGIATLQAGRLVGQTAVGALNLPGSTSGGQYVFLRAQQPVGFVTGRVLGVDGTTPHSQALVTSDTAPFVDISSGSGGFIVAGRGGADVTVRALDAATSDVGTHVSHVGAANEIVSSDLALVATSLRITASIPAANATNVALDTSISVDFSSAIDPASVTASSATLQTSGAAVAGQLTLSADHKRFVFQPGSPLLGKTGYTLALAGLRTVSGRALSGGTTVSFTTIDPSKPTLGQSGLITGDLPDDDGLVLVTGNAGAAEATSPVTATNLTTQATTTVLANTDGSFRVRVAASIGDDIALTLSDASGRSTTISLTQLRSADGTTTVGAHGGTITGAQGRAGSILPRALTQPGLFRLDAAGGTAALPSLPDGFTYADQFHFSSQAAQFNTLASLSLTESQNRFAPQSPTVAPFDASGELTVPADFLVNASLHFTALALDASGVRRTATAATLVVSGNAQTAEVESGQSADFPTVFVTSPAQALQNQLVDVHAVAPAARVDLELPSPTGIDPSATLLLVRSESIGGEVKLSIVDTLTSFVRDGVTLVHTSGRELPGMSVTGDYAVVAPRDPLVFVTGRLTGASSVASLDGSPFVFETGGPNGSFALPTVAGQTFAIHYADAVSGTVLGTSTGQAPTGGSADLGQPLAPPTALLTVAVEPDNQAIVDISQPLTFHFSEAVDARTLSTGIVVTDDAGLRVLGTATVGSDATTGTFKPVRRWRFGATYHWGVATSVLAVSGARLAQQASGSFTTFAPRVVSTTALGTGTTNDVAVAGPLVAVATDAGVAAVDVSSLVTPVVQAQAPLAGGAHGVALMPGATFTDRVGQSHSGTFAAVAAGDASGTGRLEVFDLSAANAPIDIGSSQLTTGGGVPNGVAITTDQRAVVPVQSTGVLSVRIPDAVPADPGNPTHGLGPRYPASSLEGVNQTAILGDRVVSVGAAGLTVLDATTFARRGGVSTTGDARGVAVLPAFSMDLNGDGVLAANETFDLAAVANGSDGTLQFYSVPASGDPVLLSVVHFTGETTGVALDATERIAYVGLGSHGLAFVDLDGPANIQPIDLDRNGVDDRILGTVDTPGTASRLALALDRGVSFVADGAAGLAVVQVLPPRTKFLTLRRDPVSALTGDEESILESRTALATDDALLVELQVIVAPGATAVLALDEQTAGSRSFSFADGSIAAPLRSGLNSVTIPIAPGAAPGARAILTARAGGGEALSSIDVSLASADPGTATLNAVEVLPSAATIGADTSDVHLAVAGLFSDRVRNLTTAATGTLYAVQFAAVASVDADGVVEPLGGGSSLVSATNGAVVGFGTITVDRPPVLAKLVSEPESVTLRDAGTRRTAPIVGIFSDGSTVSVPDLDGVTFTTSDPSIAMVDAQGGIVAIGEGLATISATSGLLRADVLVDDDFRRPASITALTLVVPQGIVSPDNGPVLLVASATGTGSLDGLAVTFALSGAFSGSLSGLTNISGSAAVEMPPLGLGGTVSVSASVVDPATGLQRTATTSVTLAAPSGDNEPNDDPASASPLSEGQTVQGHVDANGDGSDTYGVHMSSDGIATITLDLDATATIANVTLVVRSASGQEIARITPTNLTTQLQQRLPAGAAAVSVLTSGGAFGYQLSITTNQDDLTIGSVSPLSGGPGSAVTINGSGFSTVADDTAVLFGGVEGKLVAASSNQIVVLAPANAVDGSLEVISGERRATGPAFTVGNAQPRPAAFALPHNAAALRRDPTSGLLLDITRVDVTADPLASLAQVTGIATRLGGTVVGFIPSSHTYVMEFPANASFDGLAGLTAQVQADPLVAAAGRSVLDELDVPTLDTLDMSGNWPDSNVPLKRWFQVIQAGEAIDAIRATSPFDQRAGLKPVMPAVIDDGFNPTFLADTFVVDGRSVVTSMALQGQGGFQAVADPSVAAPGEHGTKVSSIIIEPNNAVAVSGLLNSLVQPEEDPFREVMYKIDIHEYGTKTVINVEQAWVALDHIASRTDIPIVNMSFGGNYAADRPLFRDRVAEYKHHLKLLKGRTLAVISAGNDNVSADYQVPAVLSRTMKHVITVGATAVADVDKSGEGEDARAEFGGSAPGFVPGNVACGQKSLINGGSNCGTVLTIAAPGEDILTSSASTSPLEEFHGTSAAAPVVAGVAAMVQAIRPTPAFMKPDLLRQLLIDTADDISATWSPGKMIRVNALKAVQAVLAAQGSTSFYISDNQVPTANGTGGIVSVAVDPLKGTPATVASQVTTIDLTVSAGRAAIHAHQPTSTIVSPGGEWLYVIAQSDATFGDGVVVINTKSLKPERFVPLSGALFPPKPPPAPAAPAPLSVGSTKPGMALSKDGRLLYVSVSDRIIIVNTEQFVVVNRFIDMPREYRTKAGTHVGVLESRLTVLTQVASQFAAAIQPGGRAAFGALTLSQDGRTLFAAVQTGGGGGQQPGFVLPINVDLYVDPSIQLDDYFLAGTPHGMGVLGGILAGDEPSDIAASPDGKRVYLVNGGVDAFQGVQTQAFDPAPYAAILSGGVMGVISGVTAGVGVVGLAASIPAFQTLQANTYNQLLLDVEQQSNSGITLVSAPGVTGVFDTSTVGSVAPPGWAFPSEVVFGWNPPADNGGRIVNQFKFPNVFAKRPFGISIRPDGKRALVSFFQTGNFGILDLDTQSLFTSPSVGGVSSDLFQGLAAVTPSLRFDSHLWPSRGAFTAAGVTVPSPDEALLYPGPLEYAQNGRFAVGVHTGSGPPETVDGVLPDLANDNLARLRLNEIGFNIPPGSDTGTDPNGEAVASFQAYQFKRGGGAVTILHDDRVGSALTTYGGQTVAGDNGAARPYFTQNPICATPADTLPQCVDDVFAHLFDYPTTAGSVPFYRPRGVAIQPFVAFESPRFGDQVKAATTLHVRWRHPAATSVQIDVFDLDLSPSGTHVGGIGRGLTAKELLAQAIQPQFSSFGFSPVNGHRYRIAVTVNVLDGNDEVELATASIEVRFAR